LKGLELTQVDKNREKYGGNALTPPKTEPLWIKFLKTLVKMRNFSKKRFWKFKTFF
jgi:hypothetical protein